MSSVSAVSYQVPVGPVQQANDEQRESQAVRERETQTGKDAAAPVAKPSPGTGTIVDTRA